MKDNLIKKNYLEKVNLIQKHNEKYYDQNNPAISDQEYDLIKKEIIDLENKFEFLKSINSPSKTVGFKPSKNFKKVKH